MATVKISQRKLWVDETPITLLSGEVHYWRLDPNSWRDVLKKVKDLGLYVVATYACWDFHEVADGEYDFHGTTDPRRNLVGFLEMLAEEELWIIFRPGPYIYSEWSNNGVPEHAAQYHRLDPRYLEKAQSYITAVTEAGKPYLATNGGRIILWQADNEIDAWPHIYTEELGLGRQTGPFHDFLNEQYGEIDTLNNAWRTQHNSFEQARAVSQMFVNDQALMSRYNDYNAFLHWYANKVAQTSVNAYRDLGVDVPILLNTYSGVGSQVWSDFEAIADLAGPDIYPSQEFLHRTGEHRHIFEAMRYARTFSKLPYIPEYQAGIWHDWLQDVGTLSPNHYRMICLSAMQAGAAGWNWYMIVNRDNWYQSPINEWGRTRPELFKVFQQITQLFETVDPTTLDIQTQIGVTFDPLQRSTERPGQALLESLYAADIDYDFMDVTHRFTNKKVLLYAGGSWLSADGQQRLLAYVENGGHLICIGTYPKLDEHLLPCNLLDIPEPSGIVSGSPTKLHLRIDGNYAVESPWAFLYKDTPGEPIVAERLPGRQSPSEELCFQFDRQNGTQYTIGYSIQRKQGRLTILGLQPTPELLIALHRLLDIRIPCRSQTSGVNTSLFKRNAEYIVIATNPGNESKASEIEFAPEILEPGNWHARDLLTNQVTAMQHLDNERLTINLDRKDGTIIRLYQPSANV